MDVDRKLIREWAEEVDRQEAKNGFRGSRHRCGYDISTESEGNDAEPFEVCFSKVGNISIDKLAVDGVETCEGIDVRPNDAPNAPGGTVSYNPSHDDGVDLSIARNPTQTRLDVPKIRLDSDYIQVYAILQRVALTQSAIGTDGNPLLYALKNEKGFRFASENDRIAVEKDIRTILLKFVDRYFAAIDGDVATVVIPSGNELNGSFAQWFKEAADAKGKKMRIYDGLLDKVSTETVRDEVLDDARSDFSQWIGRMPRDTGIRTRRKLEKFLDDMDKNHGGTFSYHFVKDPDIRNHMSLSMKLSPTPSVASGFGDINECHVLLLDDSISRGTSMKEAYGLLANCYCPRSVTGLVLFSPNRKTATCTT